MGYSHVPAMKTNPKFIFFTDFDGTITQQDSNDWLIDNHGFGQAKRIQGNKDTLHGKMTLRESFKGMMESVTLPFSKCVSLLVENITLDPYFKAFFKWAQQENIPIVIVSCGMEPVIRALLQQLVGPDSDQIYIVSNSVEFKAGRTMDDEDGWDLVFHDDSDFGHDKSLAMRPYAQLPGHVRPIMFYAGDGVSDLSAARQADLLFAKKGMGGRASNLPELSRNTADKTLDLVTYCVREKLPFRPFEDWKSIHATVQKILIGKQSAQEAASEGITQLQEGIAEARLTRQPSSVMKEAPRATL